MQPPDPVALALSISKSDLELWGALQAGRYDQQPSASRSTPDCDDWFAGNNGRLTDVLGGAVEAEDIIATAKLDADLAAHMRSLVRDCRQELSALS